MNIFQNREFYICLISNPGKSIKEFSNGAKNNELLMKMGARIVNEDKRARRGVGCIIKNSLVRYLK